MTKVPQYVLTASLIGTGLYLHSPTVVTSAVALWALGVAEVVLNQKNKDSEIVALLARMDSLEKKNKTLEMEITNVAERAKTVLGEVY